VSAQRSIADGAALGRPGGQWRLVAHATLIHSNNVTFSHLQSCLFLYACLPCPLHGSVAGARDPFSYFEFERFSVEISTRRSAILTKVCHVSWVFLLSPRKSRLVPEIRQRPRPSTSFPIHYSLTILLFDAAYSELLAASL
jgi:hypothetical protein